jgi:hypothetical protein
MSLDKNIEIYEVPDKICVVRNWFSEEELNLIMQEMFLLCDSNVMLTAGHNDPYAAIDLQNEPLKKGHGIFLNGLYNYNETLLYEKFKSYEFSKKLFSEEFICTLEKKNEYYSQLRDMKLKHILVNYYENKGEYKLHVDVFPFSAIVVLWKKPKKFEGGKLLFTAKELDFNIDFNTMVLFPGKVWHGVTPIVTKEKFRKYDYSGRFSIVHFIHNKNGETNE